MRQNRLEQLKSYSENLEEILYSEIYHSLKGLSLQLVGTIIPKDTFIIRTRISEEKDFFRADQLSYNGNPKRYGRANKIGYPMFYGSFTPDSRNERFHPLLTNYLEIIEILRNKELSAETHEFSLTIGQWQLKKDMPVTSIIYHQEYLKRNKHILGLYDLFLKNTNAAEHEVLEFISSEFAKEKIKTQNDYKISAAFSEYFFSTNYYKIGALFYPSVRATGDGLNMAITPNFVREYLELDRVFTTDIYIKNSCVFVDWCKEAIVDRKTETFQLLPMTEQGANNGRELSLRYLEELIERNKKKPYNL